MNRCKFGERERKWAAVICADREAEQLGSHDLLSSVMTYADPLSALQRASSHNSHTISRILASNGSNQSILSQNSNQRSSLTSISNLHNLRNSSNNSIAVKAESQCTNHSDQRQEIRDETSTLLTKLQLAEARISELQAQVNLLSEHTSPINNIVDFGDRRDVPVANAFEQQKIEFQMNAAIHDHKKKKIEKSKATNDSELLEFVGRYGLDEPILMRQLSISC